MRLNEAMKDQLYFSGGINVEGEQNLSWRVLYRRMRMTKLFDLMNLTQSCKFYFRMWRGVDNERKFREMLRGEPYSRLGLPR